MGSLTTLDWVVVGIYFLVIFGVAFASGLGRIKGQTPEESTLKNLTLATIDKTSPAAQSDPKWRRNDMIISTIVLVLIGIVWTTFTG